jgi:uncharacterized protein YuzE
MQVSYDEVADAAYVSFSHQPVAKVREVSDVCVVDMAEDGSIVGLELLSVFGFAGAALADLVSRGLLDRQSSQTILGNLRVQAKAA